MFPVNVCVSVLASPNVFEPSVTIVDEVINDDVNSVVVILVAVILVVTKSVVVTCSNEPVNALTVPDALILPDAVIWP